MHNEREILAISKQTLMETEKRFRTKLINSLAGIRQVALIGSKSKDGQENVAIFNSLIHLGAHPPLFGFISRPDSVARDTLSNIKETESYTLNFIDKKLLKQAHQTSARYPKETSEFDATGLKPEYLGKCFAPFVQQAAIKIEIKLQQIINIDINDTIMVIGQIENLHIPEERLAKDGLVKVDDLLLSGGLDAYYTGDFLKQLPYAKP